MTQNRLAYWLVIFLIVPKAKETFERAWGEVSTGVYMGEEKQRFTHYGDVEEIPSSEILYLILSIIIKGLKY